MNTRLVLLALSALAFLAPAQATDRDKLLELVRTARFVDGLEYSYTRVIRKAFPNLTAEQLTCLDHIPTDVFLNAVADHLDTIVNDEQWVIANRFYKSPVGQKWIGNLDFVIQGKGQAVKLSDEEKAQFADFEATPVGAQLTNVRKVMSSAPVKRALQEILAERTFKCGVPPESAGK